MKQHYPLDPVTGIENPTLAWANGNPATGANGSYPPYGLFLDPQKEILNLQRSAGLPDSADGSDTAQTAQALARGVWLGTLGQAATVNDLTAALSGGVSFPALLIGMEFTGVINAANTGAMTVTLAGFGTAPGKLNLVGRGGGALANNDVLANVPFRFRFDGSQFRLTGGAASETAQAIAATTRVVLKANLNVYVNGATGNDNNNGLTPTTAFATLQGAVNALAPAYDTAGYAITVNVAAGTYASVYIDQAAALKLNFLGNISNQASVVVNSPNATTPCFAVKRGSRINVQGFTLTGAGNGLDANNLGQIEYGSITFTNQAYNMSAFYVSQLTQIGPVTVGANCQGHWYSGIKSSINAAFGSIASPSGQTINFSVAFAIANNGTILANGLTLAYIAGSTGQRYLGNLSGQIFVAGAGANALPGNSAGTVDSSSTYQ